MAEEDATRQACIRSDALKLNLLVPTSMGQILNKSERIVNDMPWTSQGAIADKHGAEQIDVKPAVLMLLKPPDSSNDDKTLQANTTTSNTTTVY